VLSQGAGHRRCRAASKGLAGAAQHRRTQQDEVDRFEPLDHRSTASGRLLDGQRSLKAKPVERAAGLDGDQLARDETVERPYLVERARLAKYQP
jgi:hypothetical protein